MVDELEHSELGAPARFGEIDLAFVIIALTVIAVWAALTVLL